jgi:multidrug resistance efflux pump
LLPVLVFVGAAGLTVWLWGQHVGLPNAVGEVSAVRVDAVCPLDGTLVQRPDKPLELFDRVQADEVVARLDDGPARATLATLQADLGRLAKELQATDARERLQQEVRENGDLLETRRLAVDLERLRLAIVDRQALLSTDQIEAARFQELADATRILYEKGLESRLMLVDIEMKRDVARQRLASNRTALAEAEAQREACLARQGQFSGPEPADLALLLAPFRAALQTQEARIREVQLRIQALDVRSPLAGTVAAIYRYPGQHVRVGEPILTIAAIGSQYIVSYVREEQRIRPAVGMEVTVQGRAIPRQSVLSRVERIGPQVEPIPPHQLRDPKILEWGLPVRITMPTGLALRPGELVDVAYMPGSDTGPR